MPITPSFCRRGGVSPQTKIAPRRDTYIGALHQDEAKASPHMQIAGRTMRYVEGGFAPRGGGGDKSMSGKKRSSHCHVISSGREGWVERQTLNFLHRLQFLSHCFLANHSPGLDILVCTLHGCPIMPPTNRYEGGKRNFHLGSVSFLLIVRWGARFKSLAERASAAYRCYLRIARIPVEERFGVIPG